MSNPDAVERVSVAVWLSLASDAELLAIETVGFGSSLIIVTSELLSEIVPKLGLLSST